MTDGEFADGDSCRYCEPRISILHSQQPYAGRGNLPIWKRDDRLIDLGCIHLKIRK